MNAVVVCLLLLTAGCFAAPVEKEQSEPAVKEQKTVGKEQNEPAVKEQKTAGKEQNEPVAKEQRLPLNQRKLEQLDRAIKQLAGPEYSIDDFSKPAQLFFWKVSKMAEIDGEYAWIQRKLGFLKEEDSEDDFLRKLDQHVLLAFLELPRETQTELEAAMPALKELQDVEGVQKVMGDICTAKTGNDVEQAVEEDSEQASSPEKK
ncbi:hypothetical protein AAVH_28621 [Aphelenchoides avenae]|nr:hypothetical protein AAVH_28621 [Aphelenchus avenae]